MLLVIKDTNNANYANMWC